MILLFLLCMFFITKYCAITGANQGDSQNDMKVEDRRKRAGPMLPLVFTTGAVSLGIKVVGKLLKDAKQLPSYDFVFDEFKKHGGWKRALKDFKEVTKTTSVKQFKRTDSFETLSAKVGDRFLFLKSRGDTGNPELEIMKYIDDRDTGRKFSGERIKRIRYTD